MLSREDEEAYYQALADRAERGELGHPDPDTILTGEDATKAGHELFLNEPHSSEMEEAIRKVLGNDNPDTALEEAIKANARRIHPTYPTSAVQTDLPFEKRTPND